ncbi:MAG: hypothetical protein C0626_04325 [Arcobacter sp.]|nr:MAG: hypothetical protein C0626_04325 [Arcobacter sp.]
MEKCVENIIKAKRSNDVRELDELSNSFDYKVRRAVARNPNTSQETLNILQHDPSFNVAFIANIHAVEKIDLNDSLSSKNPCVMCEKDESTYNIECPNCRNDSYSRIIDGYIPFGKEKVRQAG